MFHPSFIEPDAALRDFLQGQVMVVNSIGNEEPVTVYRDWERPTNGLPSDFIVVYMNGNPEGVGQGVDYAQGNILVGLYCQMNDDGSVKNNRIQNILKQFDTLLSKVSTGDYFFEYDIPRFITPTSPSQSSGYSITVLNLRWHTTNKFNKS